MKFGSNRKQTAEVIKKNGNKNGIVIGLYDKVYGMLRYFEKVAYDKTNDMESYSIY